MKLFSRYHRVNLLIMVVFFLLSSLAYYFLMNFLILQELDLDLTKIEKRIRAYVEEHHAFPAEQSLDDLRISHIQTDQPVKARNFQLIEPPRLPGKKGHSLRELHFFLQQDHRWYEVTVARNLEGTNSFAKLVIKDTIVTLLVVIIASVLVNRFLFRRIWQPFYASITALHNFQLGKKSRIVLPKTNIDEFNFMNASLEKMTARAEKEYIILKEFTENASHEMQTPLAIIRSKLDLAIQEQDLSEKQSATLKSAYSAVKKLTSLNRSLLLIAKIENCQFAETNTIDLKAKLEDKILQFQELWENKINITCQLGEATINANPDLVDLLLNNLFSNSIRHNVKNGNISIELNGNFLSIYNTGKSSPLDPARLFTRFYKEPGDGENNGLGLSIVKQICDVSGIVPSYRFSGNRHIFILRWARSDVPVRPI
jgi:signal transduction histidine kinase